MTGNATELDTARPKSSGGRPQFDRRGCACAAVAGVAFAVLWLAAVFALVKPGQGLRTFYIPSSAMESTLQPGDEILVRTQLTGTAQVERGDVIAYRSPEAPDLTLLHRCVAIAGDHVETTRTGVLINGVPRAEEPGVLPIERFHRRFTGSYTVPEGHVFTMGDNRGESHDSRFFGPVPLENVVGKAFWIFWAEDLSRAFRRIE